MNQLTKEELIKALDGLTLAELDELLEQIVATRNLMQQTTRRDEETDHD